MKKLVLIFLFIYASSSFAQNAKKIHYNVLNPSFDFTLNYEKALSHVQVDGLRFLNQRRSISVEGSKIKIELFSAQELLSLYGKPISPLTITDPAKATPVTLKFEANNYYNLTVAPALPLIANESATQNKQAATSKERITNFGNTLYDSGGLNGNYASNENYTKTIYSDNGEKPYLKFTSFNIENNFDVLYIYDGPDASAKLIGAYTGGNAPTIVHATGAYLTLVFTSDNSNTASGWAALVGRGIAPPPSPMSSPTCGAADPFCSGTTYNFPATTGSTTGQTGPSYGCLYSQPNPAWYYLQVATTGNIVLNVAGSAGGDVDFICWGPFTSPTAPCATGLTGGCSGNHACSGNIVDCSYSTSATEVCTIPNAISGQYYMLMITNYSNETQNIVLNQTSGSGSTNCAIVAPCTLSASNTGPYCVGQTISIAATSTATGTYTWHGPGAYTATGQNPTRPGATAAMSGTYTVTLVSGTNTCTATTSVTVNSAPAISVTSTSVCAGSAGTLTASGPTSYTWSTGANTAAITATPVITTSYTVTGGTGTCTASTVGTITVNPKPTVTVNSGTICAGGSLLLTAGGASTYAWSPGTGLTGTTGTSVTANPTISTNYIVIGTNASGCTNTVTAVVTVNPKPTITVPSATICAGNSTVLTASGASTYTWSPATGLSGTTGASVTASVTATQNYTITGTSAAGCTNTATSAVTVNPLPTVTVTDPTICTGGTAVVTASGASTYVWSTGGNTASISESPTSTQVYTVTGTTGSCTSTATSTVTVVTTPTVTVASATICTGGSVTLTASGSSTYVWSPATGLSGTTGTSVTAHPTTTTTYSIIGTAGTCTASGTAVVTVNPLPTITATSGTICLGQQTATLTASGGISYTWSPSTSVTSSPGNPVVANPSSTQVYTVTGTDANGCINTGTSTVLVNPLPTITATSGTICLGQQTATLTASGGTTYTWSPSTSVTTSPGNPVVANPSSTQIYTITGTNANGCVNSGTTTVNVLSLPNVTATSTAICPGFAGTLTASGANSYSWNTGQNTASITQTPVSTTVYSVTGTDIHGCKDTATATITVYPTLTVTVNSATICIGQQTANLTAGGAATYVWNPTTALTPTTGVNVVAAPNATTVYTVTGIAGTCSATATSTVTVNPLPAITATSGTICVGQQTTTLTASGGVSYVWTTGAITPTVAVSPPSTQDYIVIGTDANGCIGSYTTSVTVLSLPNVTATSTAACPGFAGTITASGANTYTWSAGPQTPSLTESPIATTIYTVTGTDIHGCKDTASGTITVYSTFSITANSATICAAGEQTATLTVSGAATYTWTPSTGLSSNTGSVVTTTPAATSTVYTIVGTSAVGNCAAVATSTLTVNPLPTPTVTSNTPCAGQQALNFNCVPANLDAYLWSGPNSYNATGYNPSIPISGVTASIAGVYSVAVIDANMCTNTVTINVVVNPKPIITATGATVCIGQTINLTASGAGAGGFYSWNSPTSYTLTNPSDQNQSILNASLNMAGSYNVIGTDANTCQNAAFVQVVVNSLPIVTATSSTICVGQQTATLTANGASTYTWTGSNLTSTGGSPVTATPLSTSIYNVAGTDVNNCVNTATATVTVNSLPTLVTGTITPDCIPLCAVFTATATPAATSYTWNFGGGQVSNLPSPTQCFTVSGTSPVNVTIADINGCVSTASTNVVAFSIPVADFDYGPQPVSVLAPLVQFTNESTPGLPHYIWSFGDTTGVTYSAVNPMHTYGNAGTYSVTLTVSSSNGCSASVVKEVIINEDYVIYVPNAFTPNSDGTNEIFKPLGEGINDYKLFIFDRWGSLIFFSDDINKGWDGTYQAKGSNIVMQDVYVWKIELTNFQNVSKNLAGTVTLLK